MADINKMLPIVPRENIVMKDGSVSPRWVNYFHQLQRILGTPGGLDASIIDTTQATAGTVADRRHAALTGVYIADDQGTGAIVEDPAHAFHVTAAQAQQWTANSRDDNELLSWM